MGRKRKIKLRFCSCKEENFDFTCVRDTDTQIQRYEYEDKNNNYRKDKKGEANDMNDGKILRAGSLPSKQSSVLPRKILVENRSKTIKI